MSGKDTMGFLTESTLLPRKAREISSVSNASLTSLRAAVNTAAAGLRRVQDGMGANGNVERKRGRDEIYDSIAMRRRGAAALREASNPGVTERAAADAAARRTARAGLTLEQKSAIYDVLAGNGAKSAISGLREALRDVEPLSIPASLRRAMEGALHTDQVTDLSLRSTNGRHITSLHEDAADSDQFMTDFVSKRAASAARGSVPMADVRIQDADSRLERSSVIATDVGIDSDGDIGPSVPLSTSIENSNLAAASQRHRSVARELLRQTLGETRGETQQGGGTSGPSASSDHHSVRHSDLGSVAGAYDDRAGSFAHGSGVKQLPAPLPESLLSRLRKLPAADVSLAADPSRLLITLPRDDAMLVRAHAAALRKAYDVSGDLLWNAVVCSGARGARAVLLQLAHSGTAVHANLCNVGGDVTRAELPPAEALQYQDSIGGASAGDVHWEASHPRARTNHSDSPPHSDSHLRSDDDYRAMPPPRSLSAGTRHS